MGKTKVTLLQIILLLIVVGFLIVKVYPQIEGSLEEKDMYSGTTFSTSSSKDNPFRIGPGGRRGGVGENTR